MGTFSASLATCAGTVNSPYKGQWRGAVLFYLICAWINGWVNYREAGDSRRHRAYYDVTVMPCFYPLTHLLNVMWNRWVKVNAQWYLQICLICALWVGNNELNCIIFSKLLSSWFMYIYFFFFCWSIICSHIFYVYYCILGRHAKYFTYQISLIAEHIK